MALPDIVDILDGFPGWTTEFKLMRRDETARSQGGSTIVKRRNTPLWTLTAQSVSLRPNDLDRWRARMEALEDASRLFWGYSMSRCYPIAYPNGNFWPGESFANKLANPGFESGQTGWAGWGPGVTLTTNAHTGVQAVQLDKGIVGVGGTERQIRSTEVPVVAGKTYRMSAWVKGSDVSTAGATLIVNFRDAANASLGNFYLVNNAAFNTTWSQLSGTVVAPAGATRAIAYIRHATTSTAQIMIADDVSLARYETFTGAGTVGTINANNKAMTLKGLPSAYQVSEGDMLSFEYGPGPGYALHRIEESVTANAAGVSPEFEVRPHIRPGATVGAVVRLHKPRCMMMIVPGSVSAPADLNTGRGTVSFQGIQVI